MALLARKAGGTERPNGLGPDCRTATPTAPALQRGPDSVACERVHAASRLLRRLPELPVAPARARTDDLRPGDSGAGEPARALSPCARVGTGSPGLGGR